MPPTITLGEILEVQNGFAFKSEFFSEGNEGIPLIRIRDLKNSCTGIRYVGKYDDKYIVNTGDYLIGMDGDFEIHRWKGTPGLLNQRVCRLKNFSDDIEPEFVYYAIQKQLKEIHSNTAFVTVKHLSSKQIRDIEIPFPALAEQRRIVDILKRADSIRRLRKQAIDTARQLIPALFIDMFGDPVTNPKGWPTITLGEISSEMRYGTSKKCHGNPAIDDLPVLRIPNILDGKVDWKDLKFATLRKKEIDNLLLQDGDLLFVRTNGNPDYIGRCAVFVGDRKTLFASYLIRVRLSRQSECDPLYVKTALSMDSYREVIVRQSKTTAGNFNISQRGLGPLVLPCPKKSMQQEFVTKLSDIQSIITQQENALAKAEMAFQSLLDAIFANQNIEVMV